MHQKMWFRTVSLRGLLFYDTMYFIQCYRGFFSSVIKLQLVRPILRITILVAAPPVLPIGLHNLERTNVIAASQLNVRKLLILVHRTDLPILVPRAPCRELGRGNSLTNLLIRWDGEELMGWRGRSDAVRKC